MPKDRPTGKHVDWIFKRLDAIRARLNDATPGPYDIVRDKETESYRITRVLKPGVVCSGIKLQDNAKFIQMAWNDIDFLEQLIRDIIMSQKKPEQTREQSKKT